MKRKIVSVFAGFLLFSLLLAGCAGGKSVSTQTKDAQENSKTVKTNDVTVGLLATTFGTQSFNDDVLAGLKKAEAEFGVKTIPLEDPEISNVVNSLRTLKDMGANLIIIPSAEQRDGLEIAAAEFPDVKFIYLAEIIEGDFNNIMSVVYRENEAAFLAGAIGGLMTQTNSIGAVLANNEALQLRYQYGYMAGARAVNQDIDVQIAVANSFSDVGLGLELAGIMFGKGADFVGTYAGAVNLGVFEAASKAGDGKYVFGAANGQFDQMPDKIIASVVKPVDLMVFNLIQSYLNGEFEGGDAPKSLGLAEGGMELRWTPNEELLEIVPQEVIDTINELRDKIISGEIEVPGIEEEYNSFTFSLAK